jgi:flagellar protein FlaG
MNITSIPTADATETSTRANHSFLPRPGGMAETSSGRTNTIKALQAVEKGNRSKEMNAKEAREMAEVLNEYMDDLQTHLGFSVREDLGSQVIVEIRNRKTNELIKQIPSEELVKIMENMKELSGIIFDQSV